MSAEKAQKADKQAEKVVKAEKVAKAPKVKKAKVVDIKDASSKVASPEKLINILVAPHITEKTSLAMQNNNSYAFRVLRDSTKPEIKAAVELMFGVKVANVNGERNRQDAPHGQGPGPYAGHQESLRSPGPRPDDRLRS